MTKELSKQIMKRSESKNLYFKWSSRKTSWPIKMKKKIQQNDQPDMLK